MESSLGTMRIGSHKSYTDRFNGSIDEVAIYDSALSASRIADLAAMGNPSGGSVQAAGFTVAPEVSTEEAASTAQIDESQQPISSIFLPLIVK